LAVNQSIPIQNVRLTFRLMKASTSRNLHPFDLTSNLELSREPGKVIAEAGEFDSGFSD
jgi:hypothetical protein